MPYYGVTALIDGEEHVIYDGEDRLAAERNACQAHLRYRGRAYVSVLLDGGTWRDVKHVPGDLSTTQLCLPSCCLHPQCGQTNPLSCYCAASLTPEQRAEYAAML